MRKSDFKINYSFSFLLVLSLISGTFKEVMIFIISLIIHEIGHIICSLIFGVKIKNLKITSYGITSKLELDNMKLIPKLLIYLSGIFFNAIFIFVIDYLNLFGEEKGFIILINKILIVFNLICIYPLDGYNVFNTLLSNFLKERYDNKSFKITIIISLILLLLMFIFAIYYKSLALILIVLVLGYKNIIKIKRRDEEILYKIFSLLT